MNKYERAVVRALADRNRVIGEVYILFGLLRTLRTNTSDR